MRVQIYFALMLALAAAGCTNSRTHELLSETTTAGPAPEVLASHAIFVATTRAKSAKPAQVFGRDRSPTLSFARVDVTVPTNHQIGRIERDRARAGNPAKEFAAKDVALYDTAVAFDRAVGADSAKRGDRILVFVHGYNTGFDDGIYRVTQIAQDTNYPGTPVLFSWASGAKTVDYVYDRDSANAARDDLETTLRLLAKSQAKSIDIIAHSMGTFLTMETLRQLAISGDRDLGGKLGYVVLASPDIDVDVFKKQMARYGKPDRPFAVLLSGDDRALRFSRLIAGDKARVGDSGNAAELADLGVAVVDLTKIKSGDRLNHAKFADNPILVQLLGERLRLPAGLVTDEKVASERVDDLANGLGQAAQIVITTPFKLLTLGTSGY